MNSAVERSVNLFKQTQGPLRCLSEKDPCNHNKSILRKASTDKADAPVSEDQK